MNNPLEKHIFTANGQNQQDAVLTINEGRGPICNRERHTEHHNATLWTKTHLENKYERETLHTLAGYKGKSKVAVDSNKNFYKNFIFDRA